MSAPASQQSASPHQHEFTSMDQLEGWKWPPSADHLAGHSNAGGTADQLQQDELQQQQHSYLQQQEEEDRNQQRYLLLQRLQQHLPQPHPHQQQQHLQRQQQLLQEQGQQQQDMHERYKRQHHELGLWPPTLAASIRFHHDAQPMPPIVQPKLPVVLPPHGHQHQQTQQQQQELQDHQQQQQRQQISLGQHPAYPWLSRGREADAGPTETSGFTKTAVGVTQWDVDATQADLAGNTGGSGSFSSLHSGSILMDVEPPATHTEAMPSQAGASWHERSNHLHSGMSDGLRRESAAAAMPVCTCIQCLSGVPCLLTALQQQQAKSQQRQQQQQQQPTWMPIDSRYISAAEPSFKRYPQPFVTATVADWLSAAASLAAGLQVPPHAAQLRNAASGFTSRSDAPSDGHTTGPAWSAEAATEAAPAATTILAEGAPYQEGSRRNKSTVAARAALAKKHAKSAIPRHKSRPKAKKAPTTEYSTGTAATGGCSAVQCGNKDYQAADAAMDSGVGPQTLSGDEASGGPSSKDKPAQNSLMGSQQLAPRHKKGRWSKLCRSRLCDVRLLPNLTEVINQESFSQLPEADREQLIALLPPPDRGDPIKALTTPQMVAAGAHFVGLLVEGMLEEDSASHWLPRRQRGAEGRATRDKMIGEWAEQHFGGGAAASLVAGQTTATDLVLGISAALSEGPEAEAEAKLDRSKAEAKQECPQANANPEGYQPPANVECPKAEGQVKDPQVGAQIDVSA